MSRWEVRIAGFGGQGIILAGYLLGKAASVYDGRTATMVQSYGPEARGSACSSQVIIAEEPIHYPYVTRPDVLIALSQEAYTRFLAEPKPGAFVFIEKDLVSPTTWRPDVSLYALAATKIAEELGHRIVANIVMLGYVLALVPIVSPSAMEEAIRSSLPRSAVDLNLSAFEAGYRRGLPQAARESGIMERGTLHREGEL